MRLDGRTEGDPAHAEGPEVSGVSWGAPPGTPERRFPAEEFVAAFFAGATWQATLAVLDGTFHGLRMAAVVGREPDELGRAAAWLDGGMTAVIGGVPAWVDDQSLIVDLSAHLPGSVWRPSRPPISGRFTAQIRGGSGRSASVGWTRPRGRVWRPYAGTLVIDTLHAGLFPRAAAGPRPPWDQEPGAAHPPAVPAPWREDDEITGVVIVTDLSAAGTRILDAAALWRYTCRIVSDALCDPARPATLGHARRALRTPHQVALLDPARRLGLCLRLDAGRRPWCVLALEVDESAMRDREAVRFLRV